LADQELISKPHTNWEIFPKNLNLSIAVFAVSGFKTVLRQALNGLEKCFSNRSKKLSNFLILLIFHSLRM
jgi:hypothetical protein